MGCISRDQMRVTPHFSENDKKYRPCCGLVHVTTYSGLIAFCILIRTAAVFAISFLFHEVDPKGIPDAPQLAIGFFSYGVVTILILMCFAFGLMNRSAYCTVPFVTLMIFETAIVSIITGLSVYWFWNGIRFAEIDGLVKIVLDVLNEQAGFNTNVDVQSVSEVIHMLIVGILIVTVYCYTETCRILVGCTMFFVDVYRYNQKRAGTMIYGTAPRLEECEYGLYDHGSIMRR
ncbi:hypothetical protein L596_016817 [Steinernema carpocapsae]|uniref:Uncharacterized protein n=1 Tax=Steinernema carpocapsae TaxID=34508 RepID=A0A4U5NJ73_STECR|nr:hypothetical protein L596_016817 [Steinernema carpocapsae]